MRLINARTLELKEFYNEATRPKYAILSHRWVEGEEVLFQDVSTPQRRAKQGWAKIQFCCRQALEDGLDWAWVDTCCIDKSSSADLSEAVNSMYKWYANSTCCYAYLNDVEFDDIELERPRDYHEKVEWWKSVGRKLCRSLWFTRAWTLQELIAPKHLYFFDRHHQFITSRNLIAASIESNFKISCSLMENKRKIRDFPIAQRMSWAASRQASRTEDIAYSLFGIFDVNLPLLYGEGGKAFIRLQEEILRQTHDDSIFLWSMNDKIHTADLPLLAPSPDCFNLPQDFVMEVSAPPEDELRPYTMTNIGLRIEFKVCPYTLGVFVALLDCCSGENYHRFGILIRQRRPDSQRFVRTVINTVQFVDTSYHSEERKFPADFRWRMMYIENLRDIIIPKSSVDNPFQGSLLSGDTCYGFQVEAPEYLGSYPHPRKDNFLVAYHDWDHDSEVVFSNLRGYLAPRTDREANSRLRHRKLYAVDKTKLWTTDAVIPVAEVNKWAGIGLLAQGVGILKMPYCTSGTAGLIVFKDVIGGLRALRLGFSRDFRPVVMVVTHRDESDIAKNVEKVTHSTNRVTNLDKDIISQIPHPYLSCDIEKLLEKPNVASGIGLAKLADGVFVGVAHRSHACWELDVQDGITPPVIFELQRGQDKHNAFKFWRVDIHLDKAGGERSQSSFSEEEL